jgi:hypothetical protein
MFNSLRAATSIAQRASLVTFIFKIVAVVTQLILFL